MSERSNDWRSMKEKQTAAALKTIVSEKTVEAGKTDAW